MFVGEGVENAATFEALRELKCDEARGYFLCRPVSVPELMAWLDQRSDGRSPQRPAVLA